MEKVMSVILFLILIASAVNLFHCIDVFREDEKRFMEREYDF